MRVRSSGRPGWSPVPSASASASLVFATFAACAAGCGGASHGAPAPAPAPAPIVVAVAPEGATRPAASAASPASAGRPEAAPPEPAAPALAPLAGATCVIHDTKTSLWGLVPLAFHGKPFASFGRADEAELRASGTGATLTLKTKDIDVTGEVKLPSVAVHPRKKDLWDGWLGVRDATGARVEGGALHLSVVLPAAVERAGDLGISTPCSELAFGRAESELPDGAKEITLKPGVRAPLRDAPGGRVVAQLVTPKPVKQSPSPKLVPGGPGRYMSASDLATLAGPGYEVFELSRRGGSVKIRVDADASFAEGWVDRSVLSPKAPVSMGVLGMLGGVGGSGHVVRCPRPVTAYVRDGDDVVAIGSIHSNAAIRRLDPQTKDEVPVAIGQRSPFASLVIDPKDEPLQPFVRAASLEGCKAEAPAP